MKKDVLRVLFDEVSGNTFATRERLDFMFLNDPLAAQIRSFCEARHLGTEEMYRLIALGFHAEKQQRMLDEFVAAEKGLMAKSVEPCQCMICESCAKCRQEESERYEG